MDALTIKMLDVNEGDCFLIHVGTPSIHIMVDSGPTSTWTERVYPLLKRLDNEGVTIDLLIITHIDADHIGGALNFFPKKDLSVICIREVWFNGLFQIIGTSEVPSDAAEQQFLSAAIPYMETETGTTDISFRQSTTLSERLHERPDIWNSHFKGGPIIGTFRPVKLADTLSIVPILPTSVALSNLVKSYERQLRNHKINAIIKNSPAMQDAFERYYKSYEEPFIETQDILSDSCFDIETLATATTPLDQSISNAASIVFILKAGDRSVLFMGDAPSQEAIPALQNWSKKTGAPLYFDAIKMPHHGSKQNCMDLLNYVDSPIYLIPTDGKKFNHPSIETVAKIISRPTTETRHVIFNYPHVVYQRFNDTGLMEKYHYTLEVAGEISFN